MATDLGFGIGIGIGIGVGELLHAPAACLLRRSFRRRRW